MTKADIERAIVNISEGIAVLETIQEQNACLSDGELTRLQSDRLAVQALRDMLGRAEGCEVCCGKKLLYGHPGAFPIKVDASPYGSTLDVKVPDYGGAIGFSVDINYCPACGRPIEGGAKA